ncbi:A-kinase anchor protein 1, mitochondrial [Salmo trutta]|uniref:A-kinase anchor protein 1, mitochondrial-like n=1 Tax=Salmo trutta TaxID=8032 RepID=A0A673WH51_SALTR|nr:A-kinase anchor protein 1, mitochondrial-like [Salmo trutta]XP_029556765.1 A-kinase anchor protein 1, mitochondrial-like [Salmo trutta]XP_029556766.1 A-kinase anchor protein 1, mitochondrial-like [Salmo trutta]
MVLRLQSVLVLSLSGVLAFLGLWWYASRKKEQPTDKDKTTTDQVHLSSSTRGIGVVENGHSTGTDRDRHAVRKRSLVEQELVDCTNTQAAAKLGNVPLCQSQPEERVVAAECLSRGLDTATVKPVTERTESSAQVLPETAPKSQAQGGPEKDIALQRKHPPSEEQVSSICDLGSNPNPGESAGLKPHAPPLSETLEDTTNRTFNKEAAEEVQLVPGEVRLDPEGEVGEDKITFCFAEMNPRTDLAENCLLSKDNLSILPAVEEPTFESSLQDDTCLASPINLLTSQVSPSRQPLGILRSPQKKDQSEECELSRSNTEEINQLASSLITDVVSVAVSQVLKEKTLLEHNVGPLCNRDLFTSPDIISMGNSETGREMPGLLQEDKCSTTGRENICSSPIVYEDMKHDCSSRAETEQAELAEEDSAVGDSGSSSGHSEESSSGEDSSPSVSPQPPRGPAEGLGATSVTLPNGHRTEEVAVPGSGVNSMDSVDRYVEHEALDNQHINSPSPLSQLLNTDQQIEKYVQCYNSIQPLTVWDIEVPKHLVGRLIGKQGRYVSYLKETSGANIFIATLPYTQEFQICHIEGSKEQVDCALELIRKKFKDLDVTRCYVQSPVASLPSLPITSWLLLPHRVTVEVTVIQVASGNYVFLQQHTHPTFHALRSLDQQMSLCYSHPGCPHLPAPVEVGVICAAQMPEGAWWRAQVMGYYEETKEVELCYVDYGGYVMVKIDTLRQIRSDFVALPFQGSEAILEHIAPLPGEEGFSAAAKSALEEMTQGLPLLAQVTDCHTSGIPLVQIWKTEGEQVVSVNRALVDSGLCSWLDCL